MDMSKVRQVFLNRAEPDDIGLSSIGGLLQPVMPEAPYGLYLELGRHGRRVTAPVAPGIITTVFVKKHDIMNPGEELEIYHRPSVLALDGEREVEVHKGQQAAVRLAPDGPVVVDVARTMAAAMKRRILAPE